MSKTIKIYTYSNDGLFICEDLAKENPYDLGTYLIPSGATSKKPPVHNNKQYIIFIDGDWVIKDIIQQDPYVEPEKSIQTLINELEAQQTPRLMREAIKGELFATNKLTELDAQITALRAQL